MGESIDIPRMERAVREMLIAVGEDPDRVELRETPARVAGAYARLFSGLHEDPLRQLDVSFDEGVGDPVLMRGIPLVSLCEHHLLPMIGKVGAAYLPARRVVGFSEIVRLVEGFAARPQLQERLTAQIADALHDGLGSRGSLVVIEAEHTCMAATGAWSPGTTAVTSAARGVFADDASLRSEVMAAITG